MAITGAAKPMPVIRLASGEQVGAPLVSQTAAGGARSSGWPIYLQLAEPAAARRGAVGQRAESGQSLLPVGVVAAEAISGAARRSPYRSPPGGAEVARQTVQLQQQRRRLIA